MRIKKPVIVLLALFAVCGRSMADKLSEVCPYRSENLAPMVLGGTAHASSFTAKWEPEKAFDNVSWHFQAWYPDWWGANPDKTSPWNERILNKPHRIGKIVTRTVLSPQKCSFAISVSNDGRSYKEVATFDNVSDEVTAKFPPVIVRFIRTTFKGGEVSPVVYEQMIYEAVPSGGWGSEPGVRRCEKKVLLWPKETVAICGEPLELFAGIEETGLIKPSDELAISCPGVKVSVKRLSDGVLFKVTGTKPGKQWLELTVKHKSVGGVEIEFLPSPDASRMKPFFPLGVFYAAKPHPIGLDEWKKAAERDFPGIKELGANCLMIGPFTPDTPKEGPFDEYLTLLDTAQKHGLKLLLPIWNFAVATSRVDDITLTDTYPEVKATVKALSKHPALAGYYLFDEPLPWYSRNSHTLERLLRSLDPAHPAVTVLCAPSAIPAVVTGANMRVNMLDIYPVGKSQAVGDIAYRDAFVPGDKADFGDLMGRLRSVAPQRAFWFIPQAFGEGNLRLPEPVELRQMCWLAISRGFTGIVPFVYTTNMPDETQIGLLGANNRHTPAYDEFKRLFHDLQPLTPMLLKLKGAGRPIPAPPSVEAREFTGTDGKTYMVVVNRSVTERAQVTINNIHVELEPGDGTLVRISK